MYKNKTITRLKLENIQTNKDYLINQIWEYVKHSHNSQDLIDLKEFSLIELQEILTDCKNNF